MKIKPFLSFNGNAEEALNFYTEVFNAKTTEFFRYGEYQEMDSPEDYKNKIIHADLSFNDCTISISDLLPGIKADFGSLGHTITIFCDEEQQLKDIHAKLSVDGKIICELCEPPYAKLYSEIIDKFGVLWALIIE